MEFFLRTLYLIDFLLNLEADPKNGVSCDSKTISSSIISDFTANKNLLKGKALKINCIIINNILCFHSCSSQAVDFFIKILKKDCII